MSHAQILPQGAEKQLTRVNVGGWVGGGMLANTETSRSSKLYNVASVSNNKNSRTPHYNHHIFVVWQKLICI